MVFSSTLFLFVFLPLTLAGYWLAGKRFGNYWLLLVSLIFFGWSQPKYLWIILLNILINYTGAMLIDRLPEWRKPVLAVTVAANLALLFYFKYFDFAIDSVNMVAGTHFALRNIVLPIGISFFTFQGMSYVIDVYRGDVPVQRNLFKVGLYIVLFPQLIAGPIVRYRDIAREVEDRRVTQVDFSEGIERFITGLGKKAIIANTMAATADAIWDVGPAGNTCAIAWLGSIAYTLQIYFDFSGYSDMAIGLGRMFGFHFLENFDLPYTSKSITEFWRRWHISLSSWFRDYVYIPLGGNRRHVYRNLSIVFLLTGIWHGASWHFLVWGAWNGMFILLERILRGREKAKRVGAPAAAAQSAAVQTAGMNSLLTGTGREILSKVYTLFVVNLGWVLFRAPGTKIAAKYIGTMFGIVQPEQVGFSIMWYLDRWTVMILLLGILFASSIPGRIGRWIEAKMPHNAFILCRYAALLVLLLLSMMRIVSGTYNPFIYFQF